MIPQAPNLIVTPDAVLPPPVDQALLPPETTAARAQTSRPAPDPTVELLDGSRTVEVTALFGDTVLQVRHLADQDRSRLTPLTLGLGGAGLLLSVAGGVLALLGQLGLVALLLPLGIGLGVASRARARSERQSPDFTLGEASEADLHLASPAIPAPCFPLVEARERGGHWLNFSPAMGGDVTLGPDRVPLELLVQSGQAALGRHPGSYSYPIPHDARIKIDVGENTFLIHSVAPARPVPGALLDRVDWSRQSFNGVAVGVHAVVLLMVFLVPPDGRTLSLDMFNLDNQRVKTRLLPVKLPEADLHAFLKKNVTEKRAGQDGQPHKGPSGKMGDPKSQRQNRRFAVKGTDQAPRPARELAREAARRMGVLGILGGKSGARFASIFSVHDHALGDEAMDAMGNLIGNDVGDANGMGGLGPVGSGRGGGGGMDGSEWIGLRGPLGTIGKGGLGDGGADYGKAQGKLDKHKTRDVPRVKGRVTIKGALSKEIIRRVVRRHLNEVRYCYQQELQANPDLYGRVVVNFSIMGNGQVATSMVRESSMRNSQVEGCITQAVRRWLFPKPEGGGTVIVTYPFVLRAAGAE